MSPPRKLTIMLAVLAALTQAAPSILINKQGKPQSTGKAVYFITNGAENAVVALPIQRDGSLAAGRSTKTGGAGATMVDAKSGNRTVTDTLSSQSALTIVGNHIFAVNAGSNTISMLAIDPRDPLCLTMVGQPAVVPGEFLNTIAASAKNNLVCAATTGAVAGLSCASFSQKGIGAMDALRPFDIGQSTPPKGPLNTVSQTLFSADETKLITMVKGDPMANNTGFLSVFDVESQGCGASKVAAKGVRSSPNGTAVLFGTARIPGSANTLFATDASFGAAVLSLNKNGEATTLHNQTIAGQKATCWATISPATKSAFVTDVGRNTMVEMSVSDASIIKEYNLTGENGAGLIDLASAGNFVYALAPGNGSAAAAVVVMDVSGGKGNAKQMQWFSLVGMASASAMGMVALL